MGGWWETYLMAVRLVFGLRKVKGFIRKRKEMGHVPCWRFSYKFEILRELLKVLENLGEL